MKEQENNVQLSKKSNSDVPTAQSLGFWFFFLQCETHRNQINGDHARESGYRDLK